MRLKVILPYPAAPDSQGASAGGSFFFTNDDPQGFGLWKSDGTVAGTMRLATLGLRWWEEGTALAGVGRTLFFANRDAAHGFELWKSDGTSAGTAILKDINPGPGDADPQWLTNVGGTLLFAATDGSGARGLWRSDGTAAGTQLVQPLTPGDGQDLSPGFTLAGQTLFFVATDPIAGTELWVIPGDPSAPITARLPERVGVAPGGVAQIPFQYLNTLPSGARGVTITATLDPHLTYVGQTGSVAPRVSGNIVTWGLPSVGYLAGELLTLRVQAPTAAIGTRYPVVLTVAADGAPVQILSVEVMLAHQHYLPAVAHYSISRNN